MSDSVPTPEEIISGGKGRRKQKLRFMIANESGDSVQITQDQAKAISIVLSGLAYLIVGVKPTLGDQGNPGADFFTVMEGDKNHLLEAKIGLHDVIDRLYAKKGIL